MHIYKSSYQIQKMDCPSEEQMIRMKLGDLLQIKKLDETDTNESALQKRLLWSVLGINFSFFILEMITGWIAGSMGLVADSLDMLADSFVYILSLIAVGGALKKKKQVARISGYFQTLLALGGFWEVINRFMAHKRQPDFRLMIVISLLALIANGYSLYLLQKSKSADAHMRASMIFTSNDVVINSGVILAGILVYFFNSSLPDLVIGAIIFMVVIRGAVQILRLGK